MANKPGNFFEGKGKRSGSNLAFNDLLFNVLIGFVMLFVIAFLLINPIAKKADIPVKAEFIIVLSWNDEARDDLDLWVQLNDKKAVGFSHRENTPLHLDRDDLGTTNDKIVIDGVTHIIKVNRETITIRGIIPGDYYIVVHAYHKKEVTIPYTVTVIKVNPFRQLYSLSGEITTMREIHRLPAFTIDANGRVKSIFQHFKDVVPTRDSGMDNTLSNAQGVEAGRVPSYSRGTEEE
jgi:hypothetical protein|tara:strand:- start:2386 stop:3090 length:705 start_codon:yes stop_codon:yes gene_type:complete